MQHFKCFLINLDRNPERLDFMDKQLKYLNIDYIRFPAIDGRKYIFTKEEYDEEKAKKVNKNNYGLSPGERGCALSHKKVCEKIVSQNIKYTLVLEDDVSLPKNFKQILENEIDKNEEKNNWEYLQFNYRFGMQTLRMRINEIKTRKSLLTLIKTMFILPVLFFEEYRDKINLKNKGSEVMFLRPMYLTGCYLITKSGAEKLLSLNNPIVYPADKIQNKAVILKKLKRKFYSPMLVTQNLFTFGSSILEKSAEEQKSQYKNIL